MQIRTVWQEKSQWPQFNLELASQDGAEAFLVLKSCKIAQGKNGPFVSGPSTKKQDGTYFNLTFMSTGFQAAVLKKAQESQPEAAPPPAPVQQRQQGGHGFEGMQDDVPFNDPLKSRAFCLAI